MSQAQPEFPSTPEWMMELYKQIQSQTIGKQIIVSSSEPKDKKNSFSRMRATNGRYPIASMSELEDIPKENTVIVDGDEYSSDYFRKTGILKCFPDRKIVVFTEVVVEVYPEYYTMYDCTSGSLLEVTNDDDHPVIKWDNSFPNPYYQRYNQEELSYTYGLY